jgi:MYXO-CTERM domain-containing protein
LKRFQNTDSQCGEELDSPRGCYCGGGTQNSYAYLTDLFGAADLPPPTLALTPVDGAYVRVGFPVRASLDSVLGETSATFELDGAEVATLSPGPFAFNAPATVTSGDHVVRVTAIDGGGRTVSAMANVKVMPACTSDDACTGDTHCLGGACLPGASVDGGLGATCTDNTSCITGQCGTADGTSLCTAACDAGEVCPDGFDCLAAGASGVCWPSSDGGGCAAGDTTAPGWLLAGIGALAVRLRRRRR